MINKYIHNLFKNKFDVYEVMYIIYLKPCIKKNYFVSVNYEFINTYSALQIFILNYVRCIRNEIVLPILINSISLYINFVIFKKIYDINIFGMMNYKL